MFALTACDLIIPINNVDVENAVGNIHLKIIKPAKVYAYYVMELIIRQLVKNVQSTKNKLQ
ncbi:hypothetical protein NQ314_011279 [Rhamnusium bicolor]|uniref:Uncharacterized protein n=1 Tax=Rhamnusium bicolor TaxID=1586634 RepID=A0AAV8XK76_9CUCU|nr:hypothetical protein NQ314_011279 [Rhamnusium bicolor]